MNFLLDTHVLLWWLDDSPKLSGRARALIADSRNPGFVSAATIWEIRIKEALGKLQVPPDFRQALDRQPFEPLPITEAHAHAIVDLPMHHRDPFDRMLVAQAKCERLALVSRDSHLRRYGISLVEA